MSIVDGSAALKVGFYNTICPKAESTIKAVVQARFKSDKTITPALLRLFFHDCFVTGCDASLLLKSTPRNSAERDAGANLTVRGFDLIDAAKTAVEKVCKGKVSCADIIALATRDAVALAGGPAFAMPTGRRDGRVSKSSAVNLPGPTLSVADATKAFTAKGMSQADMVTLLGAHTVGITHCSFFDDRLWNFKGTGKADPAMDVKLVNQLKKLCPRLGVGLGKAVNLDQGTPAVVDKSFFNQIVAKKGILQLDQALATDKATSGRTNFLAGPRSPFTADFVAALVKLGNVGVMEGTRGEIRNICSKIN
jgi:peroxidase